MKILLIDNGSALLTQLQELIPGAEVTKKFGDVTLSDIDDFDAIILSGSNILSVKYNHADFVNEIAIIKKTTKPLIGICFGCELIAYAFGGTLKEMAIEHKGVRKIEMLNSELFNDTTLNAYEHHKWIIDKVPKQFVVLAKSEDGPEAIRHETLPIYGFQFHPENIVDKAQGFEVFNNIFNRLLVKHEK